MQGSKGDRLSDMLDNSIEDDDMSMLDMDHGMNFANAMMADCMVAGFWPGDLPSGERSAAAADNGGSLEVPEQALGGVGASVNGVSNA